MVQFLAEALARRMFPADGAVVRVARGACREKSCKGGTAGHEDDLGGTDHARLLYDALRLEAMSYFARTNAREMDVSVIEPLEMRGFDSLLAATKLLSKSCCSTTERLRREAFTTWK